MPQSPLGPYQIQALNTAKELENKIHDDAVARRFGFKGGLVPGVEVYAYMTHLPVMRWGRDWLERGTAECRLLKPVYDGDTVTVTASETAGGLDLRLDSHGELCATGRAGPPAGSVVIPGDFAEAPMPPSPPANRPPADETTLPVGAWFAIHPFRVDAMEAQQYLRDVRESLPLYSEERLVHPGTILHIGNWALRHNVVLRAVDACRQPDRAFRRRAYRRRVVGPRSRHRQLRAQGAPLRRPRRAGVWQRDGARSSRIAHTAIYRPRQLAAA